MGDVERVSRCGKVRGLATNVRAHETRFRACAKIYPGLVPAPIAPIPAPRTTED